MSRPISRPRPLIAAATLGAAAACLSGCASLGGPYHSGGRLYPGQLNLDHPNYIDGLNGPAFGGLIQDRADAWIDRP